VIEPVVRRASAVDAGPLTELEAEARANLAGQRGGPRWLDEHAPNGPAWTSDGTATFVADLDGVVVGYLVLDVADDSIARVESVYVTPGARELGYGDALLAVARAEAAARGAVHLEGQALPGDRDTKNLYERAGITARLITVSTRLDESPSISAPSSSAPASR
jgi:GNAT superfamily N-acetyltransferase